MRKTIVETTCDICGMICNQEDGEINININSGDRDVGPTMLRGKLTIYSPYGHDNGDVCESCKNKWLRKYLGFDN